jgi:apolipoprotein N-acyltransferase
MSSFLVLVAAGIALALAFTPLGLWYLPWVVFIPVLFVLSRASSYKEAFLSGFIFGCVVFTGTIYWLYHVASFGVLFCIAYCALYYGVFALLIWHMTFRRPSSFLISTLRLAIFVPLAGVMCEYLRAEVPLLGFGWAVLGYSQAECAKVLAFARFLGVYGISALILFFNAMLFAVLSRRENNKGALLHKAVVLLVLMVVMVGVAIYGNNVSRAVDSPRTMRVALVQPNISLEEKWEPLLKELVIKKTLKLIELVDFQDPDIIILPEAAYPGALKWEFEESPFEELALMIKTPIIIGAPNLTNDLRSFNSAFFIDEGELKAVHNKLRLVPFGEFVPFRPFFALFGLDKVAYSLGVGDFSFGTTYTLFKKESLQANFGVLVCFEDTIPSLARNFMKEGANVLVNITNDAWFKRSVEPYQHLQAARLRAVENNCYLVRAANTGISAFIAPNGAVMSMVKDEHGDICFVTGIAVDTIGLKKGESPYAKIGYLFPNIAALIVVLSLCLDLLMTQRKL